MVGPENLKPKIEKETTLIECPNCGNPRAQKEFWKIGALAMWIISCGKCGYSQDSSSFMEKGVRN